MKMKFAAYLKNFLVRKFTESSIPTRMFRLLNLRPSIITTPIINNILENESARSPLKRNKPEYWVVTFYDETYFVESNLTAHRSEVINSAPIFLSRMDAWHWAKPKFGDRVFIKDYPVLI